ncbi:hypothetical protein DENIS_2407 [Desulfonema ishimotonii]|uniref:Type I-E CRISPR-associated protein Cse2/CasB n=1 Tax=Desulfonema ishimotonii TaxID=45657 RepID=A0A401FWU0_9BACT|nr:type I-E CRISPR-associated protein Cse2/CasB [Desulfonema ishimotonii]GBC61447.1 hypothetical protein DENIS_2407 [Desulfonema ishimotonii]
MTEFQEKDKRMAALIAAYKKLPKRAQAELRRLEDYTEVPLLAAEALWKCRKEMQAADEKPYPEEVLSALLILFRDRGANGDKLAGADQRLGEQFAGNKDKMPIKPGRFKGLMAPDDLEKGFDRLRPLLRLFRHDSLNWKEVASFLNALYWHGKNPDRRNQQTLYRARKQLADAYFGTISTENR